ncbi:hypothetical protein L1987_51425 [Smallanthus sonchifolius]|uniref:Uncharacterized protein n=1 Tax=Smallanthus sonchifolius TaxID=185202 RepID=A0ACB9EQK6_9ASTR|nr:hypothetical protein L1987_51425 [Smallanthus sonchifolius]
MVALKFNDKHDVCPCFDKTHPKSRDFHGMIDFLLNSNLKIALTIDPPVYENHIRKLWSTASYSSDNGPHIQATVGKSIVISEAVIRICLELNDENDNRPISHPNSTFSGTVTSLFPQMLGIQAQFLSSPSPARSVSSRHSEDGPLSHSSESALQSSSSGHSHPDYHLPRPQFGEVEFWQKYVF